MRFSILVILAVTAAAQVPRVGHIEFYGLRKIPEVKVRKVLGFAEGDPLPSSKAAVESQIEEIPGVTRAHLEATCCDAGNVVLYVGVEERGAAHFAMREAPLAEIELPAEISGAYRDFLAAVNNAVRNKQTAEDLTQGHSLMVDPECRHIQERFLVLANDSLDDLRKVLRTSIDEEQRAVAAYVIGYAPKKSAIIDDLQFALKDDDDTVRGNAIRSIAAIAVYAKLHPDAGIKIAATWFVEMLNSLSWTDRNNAAVALVNLTETRDANALAQIRERSMASILEMARWKYLEHALPAYILLGRVAGIPEPEIQEAWASADRSTLINTVVKKLKL